MAPTGKEIIPAGIHPPPELNLDDEAPLVFLQLQSEKLSFLHFPYEQLSIDSSDVLANKTGDIRVILRDSTGSMCFGTLSIEDGKFSSWTLSSWTNASSEWTAYNSK